MAFSVSIPDFNFLSFSHPMIFLFAIPPLIFFLFRSFLCCALLVSPDQLQGRNSLNLIMLTLSDVEISNTGRRQDNKAEATQAEPGSTSMTVSFGNVYVCVSGKGKGEQKGVNVRVRIENNGLGMCVAVW